MAYITNCKDQSIFSYEGEHFKALKAVKLAFPLVNMQCKNVLLESQMESLVG